MTRPRSHRMTTVDKPVLSRLDTDQPQVTGSDPYPRWSADSRNTTNGKCRQEQRHRLATGPSPLCSLSLSQIEPVNGDRLNMGQPNAATRHQMEAVMETYGLTYWVISLSALICYFTSIIY